MKRKKKDKVDNINTTVRTYIQTSCLGLISSVANHEMLQLLSKYLSLLLPSPKSQINDNNNNTTSMPNSQGSSNTVQQLVTTYPTRE
jgi:hypothetical protein